MSTLANHWSKRGHQVTLITLNPFVEDFYMLADKVQRIRLQRAQAQGKTHGTLEAVKVASRLRRALKQSDPDIVLSFVDITNVFTLLATVRLSVPVVISERTDPLCHELPRGRSFLRRSTYRRAAALVVQTKSVSRWASAYVRAQRIHVIPNPVRPPDVFPSDELPRLPSSPFVVTVGRLEREKGIDLLIEAFALCLKSNPTWNLVILGKGQEEENLIQLAGKLGVKSRVLFPGAIQGVDAVLRRANLFVLPSRVEGFPNALVEAMATGLPVISTDCPSGPGEIITDGVDGILVEVDDVQGLYLAMNRLMSDSDLAGTLSGQAKKVKQRFSLETISEQWEGLFASLKKR